MLYIFYKHNVWLKRVELKKYRNAKKFQFSKILLHYDYGEKLTAHYFNDVRVLRTK